MSPLETLYYALTIGFIILVIFASYAFYEFSKTMRSARMLIEDVEDITRDVGTVKNTFKTGVLGIFVKIVGSLLGKR